MRRVVVISLIIVLIFLPGCRSHRLLEKQMIEFTSCELTLPEHLLKMENGTVEDSYWQHSIKVFVRYYGSEECTSCAIIHLQETEADVMNLCDSVGVVPMVVFATPDGDISELLDAIKSADIDFPIYLDIDNEFSESSEIPENLAFHHFLIGEGRHPIFVGNPKGSKRLEELFLTACREK